MSEPWVSVDDVASYLGVGKVSIYRWIEQRGLPARKIGKLWKLKLSEVEVWMRTPRVADLDAPASLPKGPTKRATVERVVLVVDDDPLVRDSVADFLDDKGYRSLLASDGDEALRLLSSASPRPSVIVLDLKMPRLDGWQFRERQLRDPELAGVPVVIVTATSAPALEGVRAVLRKPLRLPALARVIETILAEQLT